MTLSVTLSSAGPAAFSARHVSSLWLRLEETLLISRRTSCSESCGDRRDGVSRQPPARQGGATSRAQPRGRSCLGDDQQLGCHLGDHPLHGGRRLGRHAAGEVDAVPLAQRRLGGLHADDGGVCPGETGVSVAASCLPQQHRPQPSGSGRWSPVTGGVPPCHLPQAPRGWSASGTSAPPAQQPSDWLPSSARLQLCHSCSQRSPQEQLKGFPTRTLGGDTRGTRGCRSPRPGTGCAQAPLHPSCTRDRGAAPLPAPALRPGLAQPPSRCVPSLVPWHWVTSGVTVPTIPPLSRYRSQLLQGQVLEGFPGEAPQGVGGEIPVGQIASASPSRPHGPPCPTSPHPPTLTGSTGATAVTP